MDQIDDYVIEGHLGAGGFGIVHAAHHRERPEQRVALKVLHPELARQTEVVRRFFQEALVLARLEHPNIPRVLSFGPWQDTYYIAQEHSGGAPIDPHEQPLAISLVEGLMAQLLDALQYAHERGVVHRDLKLENLHITPDGSLKILDFGLASIAGAPGGAGGVGTAGWSAPEQLRGEKTDARSDLFAVGMILHALLTGRLPCPTDELDDYLAWAEKTERSSLRALRPDLSKHVNDLYARLTAATPAARPASAAQALAELRNCAPVEHVLVAELPTARLSLRLQMDREAYEEADDPLCFAHLVLELEPGHSPPPTMSADLVLVLDVSGSMNTPDKYPLLRKALGELLRRMAPQDRVSLVVFSHQSERIAPLMPGESAAQQADALAVRMDRSKYMFGGATNLAPGLAIARKELDTGGSKIPKVRRVYVLTDGALHDTAACANELQAYAEEGIEVHVYGFGSGFNGAALKELVKEQRGGSVKPICNEQDVIETFAHIAEVNRRLLGQEARIDLQISEQVDVGDFWMFRPQERYLGPVQGRRASRVLGGIEHGRSYEFLVELRLPPAEAEATTPLGEITLSFHQGTPTARRFRLSLEAQRQRGGQGAQVQEVGRIQAILETLRPGEAPDAPLRAARARLDLAVAEQRDPGLIDALKKQIDVLEGRSTQSELNRADQQYLASDQSSVVFSMSRLRMTQLPTIHPAPLAPTERFRHQLIASGHGALYPLLAQAQGARIADRYLVGPPFAGGGQGLLFEGTDLHTGSPLLIKQASFDYRRPIQHSRREAAARREAIRTEYQVLAACTTGHLPSPVAWIEAPAIVPAARDFLVLREESFLLQERIQGTTLEQAALTIWINHTPAQRELWARKITGGYLDFWSNLREKGYVYGDTSPRNILLEEGTGRLRVVDAACALVAQGEVILREATPAFLTPGLYAAAQEGRPVPGDERLLLPVLAKVLHFVLTRQEPINGGEPGLDAPELQDYSAACRATLRKMLGEEQDATRLPELLALVRSWTNG